MDMYNRYVPQPDGSFRRSRMQEPSRPSRPKHPEETEKTDKPPQVCQQPVTPPPPPLKPTQPCRQERCGKGKRDSRPQESDVGSFFKNLLPKDFDTGDLLIVLLLLLMSGDCAEDQNTALLTLALYLFL